MLWLVLLPFAAAALAPWLDRRARRAAGWILALLPLGLAAWVLRELPLAPGQELVASRPWLPSRGVELALRLDGLSATFALLVTVVGAGVLLHAHGYLAGDPRRGRLFALLLAFMGAMLGLVLADDLVLLFVFWELTGVASFLLVGFEHGKPAARRAARSALLINGAGGLALLAGLVLLGLAAADLGLDGAAARRLSLLAEVDLASHRLATPALLLILAGAFTKSAQVPFHFWLPAAMAAPTPVSAFLHSATMVKAGVYLLARLHPALGGLDAWPWLLGGFGAVTMLTGAGLALANSDLKRILAGSTVSVLGILTLLLGVGSELAVKAAVVFLVAHALYKAALFLVAGSIDHATGSRDVTGLGGLGRAMPLTAAAGVLAGLSKMGAPPAFGFVGKELVYKAKLDAEGIGVLLIAAAVVANVALVAAALLVGLKPFLGRRRRTPREPHEVTPAMVVGPLALGGLGLFVGLLPGTFERALGSATVSAILGRSVEMKLALWYGVNPEALLVLALSAGTVALGVGLSFVLRPRLAAAGEVLRRVARWGPAAAWERAVDGLPALAGRLTAPLQGGGLGRHLALVVVAAVALAAGPLALSLTGAGAPDSSVAVAVSDLPTVAFALLTLLGAAGTVWARRRLAAVAALGVTGVGLTLLFVVFSAPDVAITQILVEVVAVILLVRVVVAVPETAGPMSAAGRAARAALALAAGAVMAVLAWSAASAAPDDSVARFYLERSLPEAFGRNVVNVVLVDFRALDTLGEIAVVALAGIGVWALSRSRRKDHQSDRGAA